MYISLQIKESIFSETQNGNLAVFKNAYQHSTYNLQTADRYITYPVFVSLVFVLVCLHVVTASKCKNNE